MQTLIIRWPFRVRWLLLSVLLLSGCAAGQNAFNHGQESLKVKNYDQAVVDFMKAVEQNPDKTEYQMQLQHTRYKAAQIHKISGDRLLQQAKYAQALREYRMAADLDGSFFSATEGKDLAQRYVQAQALTKEAAELLQARRRLQAKAAVEKALNLVNDFQPALQLQQSIDSLPATVIDGVELEVTSTKLITLNFEKTKLPEVFNILTKLSGINFILDEDVRGKTTTLFLERATFAQALELLLRMNKLGKKILNSKTIILFPKTRDKQKQFADQLIHTFYLSNIDAKKAVNLLRTMLQVRKIYVHEELNAIVIRDTPAVVKLAQKIIEANDRSDSEVVFDLELMEVSHSDGLKFGPKLSAYQLRFGIVGTLETEKDPKITSQIGNVTVPSLYGLDVIYGLPSASFDLLKESGEGEVLANPKIRVKNKEKAKVHIGTREPIITVTIQDSGTTSENVQYVDVGVKLDVEPVIQLDNSIVTKLGLEVSNVLTRTTTLNGTAVLTISTTNATTTLSLKNGERTIIGGLIRNSNSKAKTSLPILGDIPFLGALFTSYDKSKTKTEILLSITPHIVKNVSLPDIDVSSIWSGGEDDLKFGRNFGSFVDEYAAGQKGLEPTYDGPVPEAEIPTEIEPMRIPPGASNVPVAPPIEPGSAPQVLDELLQPELIEPGQAVQPAVEVVPLPVPPQPLAETIPAPLEAEIAVAPNALPAEVPVAVEQIAEAKQLATVQRAVVYIDGSQLVTVGEEFAVAFMVDEIENLFSAPLYVQYDQALFEFIMADEGSFLQQDGSSTVFTHTALKNSGRIIVGLKQGAGGEGESGGGELFRMIFKAIAPGKGEIFPSRTNFRNPQGQLLKVEALGLMVETQ